MFDTSRALADMAKQIRACRSAEGLTLQQLATRSGVAASTIHKVEAQQMVPTVSVLLKISKGLGCRPEQLIRDRIEEDPTGESVSGRVPEAIDPNSLSPSNSSAAASQPNHDATPSYAKPNVGVWQIDLSPEARFPDLDLDPLQRAIVLVQAGGVDLQAGSQSFQMDAGDCIEIEGGHIQSRCAQVESASLMVIVSPPGNLGLRLGQPQSSTPAAS
jgi:transcriptional regulator with XRE-family HTH domain